MIENDYYNQDGVSHSSLSWFEESPLYYKKLKDKELEKEEYPWLDTGKQIHMKLLEPDKFYESYTHLEFEVPKSKQQIDFCEQFVTSNIKKVKERLLDIYPKVYTISGKSEQKILEEAVSLKDKFKNYIRYLKFREKYKDILSESTWWTYNEIDKLSRSHIKVNDLLHLTMEGIESYNEFPIYWKHNDTQLDCKSLLDRLIINHNKKEIILLDIKTTNKFKGFKEKAIEFNYIRQLCFYWYAIHHYLQTRDDFELVWGYNKFTHIIATKTTQPLEFKVYDIPERMLGEYIAEINNLLFEIKWHIDNNMWDHSRTYYESGGLNKLE
jgi:hypothetical protein